MDFAVFSETEMEEMFQVMLEHMPKDMRDIAIKEFGSIERWKEHYLQAVASEKMQKSYAKVVEWYGGKDKFLSVAETLSARKLQKATTNGLTQYYKNWSPNGIAYRILLK